MWCPMRRVETASCPVVYHPYTISLRNREVVRRDLDLSHLNISPLPDLVQLDALLFFHFLVFFNSLWLEKPIPWYHLPMFLSIPDATPKFPWTPPEKSSRS